MTHFDWNKQTKKRSLLGFQGWRRCADKATQTTRSFPPRSRFGLSCSSFLEDLSCKAQKVFLLCFVFFIRVLLFFCLISYLFCKGRSAFESHQLGGVNFKPLYQKWRDAETTVARGSLHGGKFNHRSSFYLWEIKLIRSLLDIIIEKLIFTKHTTSAGNRIMGLRSYPDPVIRESSRSVAWHTQYKLKREQQSERLHSYMLVPFYYETTTKWCCLACSGILKNKLSNYRLSFLWG